MKCAWQAYVNLLPEWMRRDVDRLGNASLQELRLRQGRPPELVTSGGAKFMERSVSQEDLEFCINTASQYSPWSSATIRDGYITAQGGHRLGICGDVVMVDGKMTNIKNISSLCIRVARDFPGIGADIAKELKKSLLIIGAPGSGKTTLLRDIIRQKSNRDGSAVAVVDERREIFPVVGTVSCFSPGLRTDVLSGCKKTDGIQMLIRTMNPQWVAVDEITAMDDCEALIRSAQCGVKLLATIHGEDLCDLMHRSVYKHLFAKEVFENIIIMRPDKSWTLERMKT